VEIRDAQKLWGKDPIQTQKNIREELGDNEIKVGCIQCKQMLCWVTVCSTGAIQISDKDRTKDE